METNPHVDNDYQNYDDDINQVIDEMGNIRIKNFSSVPSTSSNIPTPANNNNISPQQPIGFTPSLTVPPSQQTQIPPINPSIPVNKPQAPPLSSSTLIPSNVLVSNTSKIPFVLQNVVSTVNLSCNLDLKSIALKSRNSEYNPKRFAAVIMKIRDPKATALIFNSGKMVCTGTKSVIQSKTAAKKFAKIIEKVGFPVKFKEFKIQNIVASCAMGFPIRLEGLQIAHKNFSHYEPEIFPGLVYRMIEPKVVLLIFVTGKVVFTGAKTIDDIKKALDNIYPVLQEFRK